MLRAQPDRTRHEHLFDRRKGGGGANTDGRERDPSHVGAGNLTEKTGFEVNNAPSLESTSFYRPAGLTSYKENASCSKSEARIQVRGIQDEETISRGRRPARPGATEDLRDIYAREPAEVYYISLSYWPRPAPPNGLPDQRGGRPPWRIISRKVKL